MAAGISLVMATGATGHDATPTAAQPLGWKYPFSCCSQIDCYEDDAGIAETATGYTVRMTNETFPYTGDARVRQSPDGKFHRCSQQGKKDKKTLCIFVPPRGF